ncbi:MAG: sulfur carrier protein ThiS [Proteobacteria bacterium]|nr:sulfur carrier protein ThiS [Pseudomonadota bacterium]
MQVLLNGDPHSLEQDYTIEKLIGNLDIDGKFAVEINQNIIPRSQYSSTQLKPGDNIEIVQAIGGG